MEPEASLPPDDGGGGGTGSVTAPPIADPWGPVRARFITGVHSEAEVTRAFVPLRDEHVRLSHKISVATTELRLREKVHEERLRLLRETATAEAEALRSQQLVPLQPPWFPCPPARGHTGTQVARGLAADHVQHASALARAAGT
eukprot:gene3966-4326_t